MKKIGLSLLMFFFLFSGIAMGALYEGNWNSDTGDIETGTWWHGSTIYGEASGDTGQWLLTNEQTGMIPTGPSQLIDGVWYTPMAGSSDHTLTFDFFDGETYTGTGIGLSNNTMKTTSTYEEGWGEFLGFEGPLNYTNWTVIEDNGTLWNITNSGIFELTSFTLDPGYSFPPVYTEGDVTYVEWDISQVPIPAAFWLFASGLIGLVGIRRRLNK